MKEYSSTWKVLASIALVFVVWGHHFGHAMNKYIFSFHVPLLYFLAGMLDSQIKLGKFKEYLLEKLKSILLPYFLFALILYGIWFVIIYMTGTAAEKDLSPINNLLGIFYAQGMHDYMDWGMHMWFFPSLFITTLVAYPVIKWENNKTIFWIAGALIFTIGLFSKTLIEKPLPWCIDASLVCLPFYLAGKMADKIKLPKNKVVLPLLTIALLAIGFLSQYFNTSRIDLKQHFYGNPILFLSCAFSSIFAFYFLTQSLSKWEVIGFIGPYSIPVFIFHLRIWTFINVIIEKVLPGINRTGLIETFAFSIVQIGAIIILAIIYDGFKRKIVNRK